MSPMILQRDPAWYVRHCCLCGRSLAGVATADPIRITRDGVPVMRALTQAGLASLVAPTLEDIGNLDTSYYRASLLGKSLVRGPYCSILPQPEDPGCSGRHDPGWPGNREEGITNG